MDYTSPRFRSFPPAMIRTAWFAVVPVGPRHCHGAPVPSGAPHGGRGRPGGKGGGGLGWGTTDWARDILAAAGTPVRVTGLERIPAGPVVYASNHSSMFDI